MAGLATTTLANRWLDMLRGVAFTAPAGLYVKLHTAEPGSAGTSAAAVGSPTRMVVTLAAAGGGSVAMTGTAPTWQNSGTNETLAFVTVWDTLANGTGAFLWSAQLTATQVWASGNSFTLTALSMSLAPTV